MELYGEMPSDFHMSGMLETPRIAEWEKQLITYVYRAIMVSELSARVAGMEDTEKAVRKILVEYKTTLDCYPSENPEEIINKCKIK